MLLGYLAIDQYGNEVYLDDPSKPPRGQLLRELGYKKARKMYTEKRSGRDEHTGYIIGGRWFRILEVHSWEAKR